MRACLYSDSLSLCPSWDGYSRTLLVFLPKLYPWKGRKEEHEEPESEKNSGKWGFHIQGRRSDLVLTLGSNGLGPKAPAGVGPLHLLLPSVKHWQSLVCGFVSIVLSKCLGKTKTRTRVWLFLWFALSWRCRAVPRSASTPVSRCTGSDGRWSGGFLPRCRGSTLDIHTQISAAVHQKQSLTVVLAVGFAGLNSNRHL